MVKARFYSRLLGALAAPDGQEQNGRREMGKGKWEKGWEKGDGKREMEMGDAPRGWSRLPPTASLCPARAARAQPHPFSSPGGFIPTAPDLFWALGAGSAWNGAAGQQQLNVAAPHLKTQ